MDLSDLDTLIHETLTCMDRECKRSEGPFTVTSTLTPKDSKRYLTVLCVGLETIPANTEEEFVNKISEVIDCVVDRVCSLVACGSVVETKIFFPEFAKFVRRCQDTAVETPRIAVELYDSRYRPNAELIFDKHGAMASDETRYKL